LKIDEIDKSIIEFLYKDSQISFRKMAKEMGLSTDTIARRYKKMIEEKIIHPVIQIDITKFGYEGYVFFSLMVESQNIRRTVTNTVAELPDIVAVMEETGSSDLTVITAVRSITHTFEIGENISKTKGVRRVWINSIRIPNMTESSFYQLIYPPQHWNNLNANKP
jgi:DNA-binding Lrp family transcriptional regulator